MHGLVNKAIQRFATVTYGAETWKAACKGAGLAFHEFESMLHYDDGITHALLEALAALLHKPEAELLEDLGTFLVSHPSMERLRRLLRFGGEDFVEFLFSLEDLPDRARLAVCDLVLPALELEEDGNGRFVLRAREAPEGFGHLLAGALRAMADDYGALIFLDVGHGPGGVATVSVTLVQTAFSRGRAFSLGSGAA